MTLAARVIAEIDAWLLDALVTHTPIPGVGVDGLVRTSPRYIRRCR
jgi:hypothetical protein